MITHLRMELFEALVPAQITHHCPVSPYCHRVKVKPGEALTADSPCIAMQPPPCAMLQCYDVTMLHVTHNLLPSRLNCCANCSVQSYYRIILRHIVKVYLAQHKVHRDSVSTMGSGVQIYVTWHMVHSLAYGIHRPLLSL